MSLSAEFSAIRREESLNHACDARTAPARVPPGRAPVSALACHRPRPYPPLRGWLLLEAARPTGRGRRPLKAVEFVVCGPPPYGEDAWNEARELQWARASYQWVRSVLGQKSVVASAALHRDETAPHIHVLAVPLDRQGKLGWCRVRDQAIGRISPGEPHQGQQQVPDPAKRLPRAHRKTLRARGAARLAARLPHEAIRPLPRRPRPGRDRPRRRSRHETRERDLDHRQAQVAASGARGAGECRGGGPAG